MNARYLLDTNTISHFLREHPLVVARILRTPTQSICISAISEGELLFGLAKKPDAWNLQRTVRELLQRLDVCPWDRRAAEQYGAMRADLQRRGRTFGAVEMLIAAQALGLGCVLVTNDRAFRHVSELTIEDWTAA